MAAINMLYIVETAIFFHPDKSGTDEEMFASVFPRKLATDMAAVGALPDLLTNEDFTNRRAYIAKLLQVEDVVHRAQIFLRQKKLERTVAYRKQFDEYAKSDWLGYVVRSRSEDERYPMLFRENGLPAWHPHLHSHHSPLASSRICKN